MFAMKVQTHKHIAFYGILTHSLEFGFFHNDDNDDDDDCVILFTFSYIRFYPDKKFHLMQMLENKIKRFCYAFVKILPIHANTY